MCLCTSHFEPKIFDQVGRGVREGQNMVQNGPWVKDPGNGLKSIRGSWRDHFGGIFFGPK